MKRLAQASMALAATALLLSGCNAFNRMQANVGRITATAVPEVVTLNGNVATTDVIINFPPRYFYEEMILRITPVLVFQGGEIAGEPKFVVGQDVVANYPQISWRRGGQVRTTVNIPYDPRASLSTLELRIDGRTSDVCKNDRFQEFTPFGTMVVAHGVSSLQNLLNPGLNVAPHNFDRNVVETQVATMLFNINRADVRVTNQFRSEVEALNKFIAENKGKAGVTVSGVQTRGYASPDGTVRFNNDLANRRAVAGDRSIKAQMKNNEVAYTHQGFGEDWAGFEKLVRESNIQDKDFVLQLIAMHSDVEKREREIRNLSSWNQIKKDILPPLRRAEFVVEAHKPGKSDAELLAAARRGDRTLTESEMLFASTLFTDNTETVSLLRLAAQTYPRSAAVQNNFGVALLNARDFAGAQRAFQSAWDIAPSDNIAGNLATAMILNGNAAGARQYIDRLGAGARDQMGLQLMLEGNYDGAARFLTGSNRAVLELQRGNTAAARTALQGLNDANADYLRAVVAARDGQTTEALNSLRSAFSKDASLKARALRDVEFVKLQSQLGAL